MCMACALHVYTQVLVVHPAMTRLPDGVALQTSSLPPTPLFGHTSARHLHELLNNAVLVSARPGGRIPRAIAASALRTLERFGGNGSSGRGNRSGESATDRCYHRCESTIDQWGLLGPRATTDAWVWEGLLDDPSSRLYGAPTFGFESCGRPAPTAAAGSTAWSSKPGIWCVDRSSSVHPVHVCAAALMRMTCAWACAYMACAWLRRSVRHVQVRRLLVERPAHRRDDRRRRVAAAQRLPVRVARPPRAAWCQDTAPAEGHPAAQHPPPASRTPVPGDLGRARGGGRRVKAQAAHERHATTRRGAPGTRQVHNDALGREGGVFLRRGLVTRRPGRRGAEGEGGVGGAGGGEGD